MANIQTIAEAIALAKSAFETGHITSLIAGEGDYAVLPNRYVSADIPTHFSYVLRVCIYGYFKDSMDSTVPEKFKHALIQMLKSGESKTVWCAYSMLWFQCFHEAEGDAAFSIIDDELIKITRDALLANKNELEKCFVWEGKKRKNGLWGDIEKSEAILRDEYGRHFL